MTAIFWLIILISFVVPSAYAATQAHLVQIVTQASTTTSLQLSAGPTIAMANVTLAISVRSATGPVVPDGTIVVSDGSSVIDSVSLTNGTASMIDGPVSLGPHQLVACYSGDVNFSPSCSAPVNLSALAPYTLQQTNPSAVVTNAIPFVDKLSIIPARGFVGTVELACQVPSDQCGLSPSTVSFSGDGKPQVVKASFVPSGTTPKAGFVILPLIGLIGFQVHRKHDRSRVLVSLIAAAMALGLAGCGPIVSVPVDFTNFAMRVSAVSGAYTQTVSYQIQVDTDVAKQ